jgi:transmembrane sensor
MSDTEAERLRAARWFLDIHDTEDPSAELLQEWMRWMEASESHRRAFARIESTWQGIPDSSLRKADPTPHRRLKESEYDGSISVDAWLARGRRPVAEATAPARRTTLDWRRRSLWVAAAATAVIVALTLRYAPLVRSGASPESFATDTGQQMQITLPDGSQAILGARSRLTVAYTPASRNLRLERGEAFFSVHKNHGWPFRVHVLNDVVTAVGTQFDVRTINNRIDVSVAEGVVQVNADTPAEPSFVLGRDSQILRGGLQLMRVRRGETLSFLSRGEDRALASPLVTRIDPRNAAQWRDGWLIYRDEPLREVLADVARYSNRRIVVTDSAMISQRFTGAVYKDSIAEWIQSLDKGFPVSVTERRSEFVVAPRPKPAGQR